MTIGGHADSARLVRAVDATELVAEVERWLNSADVTALAALDGRFPERDALDHQLIAHGRLRVLLHSAFVRAE